MRALVALVMLPVLLGGCGRAAPDVTSPPPDTVTVGFFGGVYSALVHVAAENGYFRDEGVEVVLRGYESGSAAVDDLVAGKVDLATAAAFVVTSNRFEHPELRVVASMSDIRRNMNLVARADRGISGPADLPGKTVAVPPRTQAQYFLETHLALHLVPRDQMEVVSLSPSEGADALVAGDVDAVMIWEPNASALIERMGPGGTLSWDGQDGQEMFWLLVGTETSLAAGAASVEAVVRALHRAEREALEHPEAAEAAVAQGSGLSREYVAGFWPESRFELSLSQSLLSSIEEEGFWMVESGMVAADAPPDVLEAFYFPALEAVAPQSITVIR